MQIALTKKLADAMGLKISAADEKTINPLFLWTANWTNVWSNLRTEDMLVLVNNATRFTVAIYQVKRKDLKSAEEIMKNAISHTLLYMNINPEIVSEYMHIAGEVEFVKNSSRQAASWVTKAGLDCAIYVGIEYNEIGKMFCDTIGASINYRSINYSHNLNDRFIPYKKMINELSELTGKKPYKYRAFELMITLDLEIYKAERRIIVPADIELAKLHKLIQYLFGWENRHLYDFIIPNGKKQKPLVRMVPYEEDIEYDQEAILLTGHRLSEFMPKYKNILYTYDMGDWWRHDIHLVRVIEDYDKESPYLVEARGKTPPEDVGGVQGFLNFREIIMNPEHPRHMEMKEWARFWTPELYDRQKRPRVIYV